MDQFLFYPLSSPFGVVIAFLPISVICAIAVYCDARRLGSNLGRYGDFNNIGPRGWALMVLLFWIFAFPMYLIKRPLFKKMHQLREDLKNGMIDEETFEQRRQAILH